MYLGRVVHVDGFYAAVKFPCVSKDVSGIFPKDKDTVVPANEDVVTNIIKMLDQNEVRLMKKDDLQVNIMNIHVLNNYILLFYKYLGL